MRNLIQGFGPQLVLVAAVAGAAVVCALAARGSRPGPFRLHWPAAWLTAGSLAAIAIGTLTRRGATTRGGSIELEPFHTLRSYLRIRRVMAERGLDGVPRPRDFPLYGLHDVPLVDNQTTEALVAYAVGNVALFVPLGFFVYFAVRRSALLATLAGAATSLSVEILQLPIWSRSTDIDDFVLNTTGTALGAFSAVVLARLLPRRARPSLLFPPEPEPARSDAPSPRTPRADAT